MRILWDEPKRLANFDKHGLDFNDLQIEFFLASVVIRASGGRFKAIGLFAGHPRTVIFRPLGTEAVSVISFRAAGPIERKLLP